MANDQQNQIVPRNPGEVFRALASRGIAMLDCYICEQPFSVSDLNYFWHTEPNKTDIIPGVKFFCGAGCGYKFYGRY